MSKTEIQNYIRQKKEIYTLLINFMDCNDDSVDTFQPLIQIIQTQKVQEYPTEFKLLLNTINAISKYHHTSNFHNKINRILKYLESGIKQTFSNFDIFNIFKDNRSILLFLFQNEIIKVDDFIINYFINDEENKSYLFFYPEIKQSLLPKQRENIEKELFEIDSDIFTDFDQKRQKGVNDSTLCSLIREDSIDEFIIYINKNEISLYDEIKRSLFETNNFLMEEPTISEYATFYGSIQIFKYLQINDALPCGIDLSDFAIHSNNPEIISIVEELCEKYFKEEEEDANEEEEKIIFNSSNLEESIKCHNSNLIDYYYEKINLNDEEKKLEIIEYSLKYYNFHLLSPEEFNDNSFYKSFFIYNYLTPVNYILNDKEYDINEWSILMFFF